MMKSKKVRVFYVVWEQQQWWCWFNESAILLGLVWHLFCFLYVNVVGNGDGVEPMDDTNK
jgi:hypothetical protein